MNLLFLGMTLSVVGKGLLALGVVWVHVVMATERRFDDLVIRSFRTELIVTIAGFALILAGYIIEVSALGLFSNAVECIDANCSASVLRALAE